MAITVRIHARRQLTVRIVINVWVIIGLRLSETDEAEDNAKMILNNLSKFNIFIFIILSSRPLAETAINQLANNAGATKEIFLPEIPQAYYIPYQKYIPVSGQSYISPSENKIPTVESSTEKSISSSAYRLALDASKYTISQAVKPSSTADSTQVSYPYLYTLAEVPPSTTIRYPTVSGTRNDFYEEVPKKYQYGYRVSNPSTGAEFGHSEVNDGISARGYYHVLLPDGRLQNVKYWAGPSGYHATITYESQY